MKRSLVYFACLIVAVLSFQTAYSQMPRYYDKVIYWAQPSDFREDQKIPRIAVNDESQYAIAVGYESLEKIRFTLLDGNFNVINASLTNNVNSLGRTAANRVSDIKYDRRNQVYVVLSGVNESQYSLVFYDIGGNILRSVFVENPNVSDYMNANLIISDNGYYYIQTNYYIDCFDPGANSIVWRKTIPETTLINFAASGDGLFCIGSDLNRDNIYDIYELDLMTGNLLAASRVIDNNGDLVFPGATSRRMMAITIGGANNNEIFITMGLDLRSTPTTDQMIGVFHYSTLDITLPPTNHAVYQQFKSTEGVHDIMYLNNVLYIAGEDFMGEINPTTLNPIMFRDYTPMTGTGYWFTIPNELFRNLATGYPSVLAYGRIDGQLLIGHYIFEATNTQNCSLKKYDYKKRTYTLRVDALEQVRNSEAVTEVVAEKQAFINEPYQNLCLWDVFKPHVNPGKLVENNNINDAAAKQVLTNDNESIYLGNQYKNSSYTVYTLQSSRVLEGTVSGSEIDISNLLNGVYILVLRQNDGKVVSYKFSIVR